MTLSMYDASSPVFVRTLRNLDMVLATGEAPRVAMSVAICT
jgi:hypothetical protein